MRAGAQATPPPPSSVPPSNIGHPGSRSMFLTEKDQLFSPVWGTLRRTLTASTCCGPVCSLMKPLRLRCFGTVVSHQGAFTRALDIRRGTQTDYQEAQIIPWGVVKGRGYTRVPLEIQLFPNIDTMLGELSRDRQSASASALA